MSILQLASNTPAGSHRTCPPLEIIARYLEKSGKSNSTLKWRHHHRKKCIPYCYGNSACKCPCETLQLHMKATRFWSYSTYPYIACLRLLNEGSWQINGGDYYTTYALISASSGVQRRTDSAINSVIFANSISDHAKRKSDHSCVAM